MGESTAVGRSPLFHPPAWLFTPGSGRKTVHAAKGEYLFRQGDEADRVFYIRSGRVRASVTSDNGKEATVAVFGPGELFGLSGLVEKSVRTVAACALVASELTSISKPAFMEALHHDPDFMDMAMERIVRRLSHYEEALTHHITNNSERRLARALLNVCGYDGSSGAKTVEGVTQEMLAAMVGTTRPRINGFMNKFRRLGYIDYQGNRIRVHGSLVKIIL